VAARERPGRPPGGGNLLGKYDRRKREVVNTAARLFAEQGYRNTSVDDLVRATGLQRGGLYHYIDSKQELLLLAHEELMEPLLEQAEAIAAGEAPADEKLRALVRAWVEHVATHLDHMVVFTEERRLIESDPAWSDVRASRARFQRLLEGVLRQGVDEGAFAIEDVDVAELSILGIVNHMPQWLDPHGRLGAEDLADRCVDLLLAGLLPRGAARGRSVSATRAGG
jgi:TetR/AcrR family transcriptional regulator, cholesterol catabolism regulator